MFTALPANFNNTVVRIFGAAGSAWLAELPALVERCRTRWRLENVQTISALSIHFLAFATMPDGKAVVLKIGVPNPELATEITTLRLYAGCHSVCCLDADQASGALLLERLLPGQTLAQLEDDAERTALAARLMRELPRSCQETHGLPTFAEWLSRAFARYRTTYSTEDGPLGRLLVHVEAAFAGIEREKPCDMLLHGDLHHENILFDTRKGWTAIDPKGVRGACCLETGRFLHNQLPPTLSAQEIQRRIEQRIDILSACLAYPAATIINCALVDIVLSLCWSLEESHVEEEWYHGRAIAQQLSKMADR